MTGVDELMALCPLKHEVRVSLWEGYVRKVTGARPLSSYLTLYSPPLMDVKLLAEKDLIRFDGVKYVGVVGATYDDAAYSKATSQLKGRLDLLLPVNINDVLGRPARFRQYAKQLQEHFPFQAINLDYTNSLFAAINQNPISLHLAALDSLIRQQDKADAHKFALFITTRSDPNMFAGHFINDLRQRITRNINSIDDFRENLVRAFACDNARALERNKYTDFVSVGLAKLVAGVLEDYFYYVRDCDAIWLVRDNKPPVRWLLHLAFLIERTSRPSGLNRLSAIGQRSRVSEREIINFVKKHADGRIGKLKESLNLKEYDRKHRATIARLAAINFEVAVPEPKK